MIRSPIYRIRPDVVHRSLEGEHYLLSADSSFHVVDDPVGALVLDRLQAGEGATAQALAAAVLQAFDAPESQVMSDVSAFLDTLLQRGVLERVAEGGPR